MAANDNASFIIYEVWSDDDATSLSVAPASLMVDLKRLGRVTDATKPLYSIRAASWTEAMKAHHEIQGWEPYVPMDPEE